MFCSSNMTYLSVTSGSYSYGDRKGEVYYQAHFLDAMDKPVSFAASDDLYDRLSEDYLLGDSVTCDLDIITTQKGTFTRLLKVTKR